MAPSTPWMLRIKPHELERIRARAAERHLSAARFLILCALGEIEPTGLIERVNDLEKRTESLERMAQLGAL